MTDRSRIAASLLLPGLLALGVAPTGCDRDETPAPEAPTVAPPEAEALDAMEFARDRIRAGAPAEAIPALQRYLAAQPNDPVGHGRLAWCLERTGDVSGAYRAYRAAVAIDPGFLDAHLGLGLLLAGSDRTEEALLHLDRAIALDPANPLAHARRGLVLGRMGRIDDSLAAFEAAEATERPLDASDWFNWGFTLMNARRPADAEAKFRRALEARPDHVSARLQLGVVLETTGRRDEAIACYREVLRLVPDSLPARERLQALGAE